MFNIFIRSSRSEQVWEERPLEVCLIEDEAHKPDHGNAAKSHLQLQGENSNTTAQGYHLFLVIINTR
jgi:hypothetical protein